MKDKGDNDGKGKDGAGTGIVTKTRPKVKKPSLYKVLLLNDDYTPMEFVVHILYNVRWRRSSESMPSLSRSLETALHHAIKLASDRHHEYATLEHLLLALMDDADAGQVMKACNVDTDSLR